MENHNDIIDILKSTKQSPSPDDIVQKVMEGAKKPKMALYMNYTVYCFSAAS